MSAPVRPSDGPPVRPGVGVMARHSLTVTVNGKDGERVEDLALAACEAYFGAGVEYVLTVDSSPLIKTYDGTTLGYEAEVSARVVTDHPAF